MRPAAPIAIKPSATMPRTITGTGTLEFRFGLRPSIAARVFVAGGAVASAGDVLADIVPVGFVAVAPPCFFELVLVLRPPFEDVELPASVLELLAEDDPAAPEPVRSLLAAPPDWLSFASWAALRSA